MSHNKIRIIWTSGSGKSTLATMLSKKYHILSYDLDDIYFESKYDIKRNKENRKSLISELIQKNSWIIEWVYVSERVNSSFDQADIIIYCYASKISLIFRLLKREVRKWSKVKHILWLIRYALNYNSISGELETVLAEYKHKIIHINMSKNVDIDAISLIRV